MSQLASEQSAQGAPLDFENLVEKQRQLLQKISSSSSTEFHSKITTPRPTQSGHVTDDEEQEWISDWQFKRVPSSKKHQENKPDTESRNCQVKSNLQNNEGGVFYFERINPSTPARVSATDSDIGDNSTRHEFDSDDFCLDMTIDNDDLFADLEAAAVSNDDSQISLDDFMEMDVSNGQQAQNHVGQYHSFINDDVDGFLNNNADATNALMDDDDVDMMSNDDSDELYQQSSPITPKATVSNNFGYTNSPTSVAQHSQYLVPPLMSGCTMTSSSTRPALQEMRKMMTELMDDGKMPRSQNESRLPCAEGMDQMYLDTLRKLSASMARTKKTRKSLSLSIQSMQHTKQEYKRVNQVLESVQTSSRQVDSCLRSVRMMSL